MNNHHTPTPATTVGIIGFGVFGRFMAEHLAPYVTVLVDESRVSEERAGGIRVSRVPFAAVCNADVVIPCVPVQHLEATLVRIAQHVRPGALVADVSSVKTIPVELMTALLPPGVDILATHPLFGPQSGANGIAGLPMVVWPVRIDDKKFARLRAFLADTLKLDVQDVSPAEHDQEMAYVHALTFMLGKAFSEIDIPDTPLKTKTYQHLLEVRRIVESDTPELFITIQRYNPFASEMRQRFVNTLDELERQLDPVTDSVSN